VNPITTAATPVLSLVPARYYLSQTLAITDATPGAAIYYTLNGNKPSAPSQLHLFWVCFDAGPNGLT